MTESILALVYLWLVYIAQMDCFRFQTNPCWHRLCLSGKLFWNYWSLVEIRIYKGYCSLMISKSGGPFWHPSFSFLLKIPLASLFHLSLVSTLKPLYTNGSKEFNLAKLSPCSRKDDWSLLLFGLVCRMFWPLVFAPPVWLLYRPYSSLVYTSLTGLISNN